MALPSPSAFSADPSVALLLAQSNPGQQSADNDADQRSLSPDSENTNGSHANSEGSMLDIGPPYTQLSSRPPGSNSVRNIDSSAPTRGRKRPLEDHTVTVQRTARRMKLSSESEQTMLKFILASEEEQNIMLLGLILQTRERVDQIQPATAAFKLPQKLHDQIEKYATDVLLCPELSAYCKQPTKILLDIFEHHPSWGYTKDVKTDVRKSNVVRVRIQNRLTDRRNSIKAAIARSLGTVDEQGIRTGFVDIFGLLEDVIRQVRPQFNADMGITLLMCGRFAFLRGTYLAHPGLNFWKEVDIALENVRTEFKDRPKVLSLYFKRILENDLRNYGQVDLDDLEETTPTSEQVEVNAFATGNLEELEAVSDEEDAAY
ncbi:hypothetical protein NM688_g351 [Phlebia brevispora]|uniref:Uncharacterized protein n=1 Tax=Phlebia brevispora TaxID=194682 RepID=A0ACC1TEG3_9APHY|nr:hypothetical protein NM688_g351 [Phlebia brevispora]